ncbi:MAG: sialidase family protein [Kofleriaceae bacterium]
MPSIRVDAWVGRRAEIERHLVCAMQGQFPVIARGSTGEVAAVFRVGAGHYGLTGTLATALSTDGGRTWSGPIEVAPRGEDVRNPAFAIVGDGDAARDGRWVLAYWQAGMYCYPSLGGGERKWRAPREGGEAPDMFVVTSEDRGRTWSAPFGYRSEKLAWVSPFGRMVALADGTLVMSAYGGVRESNPLGRVDTIVVRSRDGGRTWGDESTVVTMANEMSLCVVGDELVGAARRVDGSTAIVRSADGGQTWSAPVAATRSGEHPADLCVLRESGHLLMTYGRRVRPLGCATKTSRDGGATWTEHEVLLAGDGIGHDVGYPSTVQLDDGTLLTALYFANGSAGSEGPASWGETSCQVLRYPEALVVG